MEATGLLFLVICVLCATADLKFNKFGFINKISDINSRIIGGEDAKVTPFPYQISLRSTLNNEHFCGGSILNSKFLLTAAHCTQGLNLNPEFVYAVIGSLRRLHGGIVVNLNNITPHEGFSFQHIQNDISLLRTVNEIIFTDLIQPIALPSRDLPEGGNTSVILSGWGHTEFPIGQNPLSDILQFSESRAIGLEKCREQFGNHPMASRNPISEKNLCTRNVKGVGACKGDSGGPVVDMSNPEKKTLVGVVSWGVPCAKGYPDVMTRVYSYIDWIERNIAEQSHDF